MFGFGDRISLYTFGAPRVGNQKWSRYVNGLPFASRMFRIHRKGDPIPYLPPTWVGYEHSTQMYQILDGRSLVKCQNEKDSGESSSCMSDYLGIRPQRHRAYFRC